MGFRCFFDILVTSPIIFLVAVADTELPIDQEEAIADAEFADYKRYLDNYIKETCGDVGVCHLPAGVCQKAAEELQLQFHARNVTKVRRVAQLLVAVKTPKYFACGARAVCRTYTTRAWMTINMWWGSSHMLTKTEIDDWMVKTKDGAGLIERFRAKIFSKEQTEFDRYKPSEFDLGLADDMMPAYTVWIWQDSDWRQECTGETASAPELGGQIRHLEWHDIQNRLIVNETYCVHFSFFF
ncbi:unnamed protein product, partial [Mesorhabditis spiculigera]